jgi:hypothetical protein
MATAEIIGDLRESTSHGVDPRRRIVLRRFCSEIAMTQSGASQLLADDALPRSFILELDAQQSMVRRTGREP